MGNEEENSTHDQNYADYKAMVTRGNYGKALTKEEWEKVIKEED